MAVYPSSVVIELYLNAAWVDISEDVVSEIKGSQGLSGTGPTDRVASIGVCSMSLDNVDNKYTPGHVSVLSGWNRGVPLRVEITYESVTTNVFWGRVEEIKLDSSEWGDRNVSIVCLDYMNIPSKFPLKEIALETDKRIEQGVQSLVTALPIAPQNTSYGVGLSTFPTVFDAIRDNTRAVAEFQKLAISEVGYIYIKRDDTLVVESREDRKGTDPLKRVVVNSGFMLKEDGGYILKEDGGKIELNAGGDVIFDNTMTGIDIEYGNDVVNEVISTAFPRKVGTSLEVLFTLEEPIRIRAYETVTLKGKYSDPVGGNAIHGTNMQTPVATTDYLLNLLEDGTGANKTGFLTVTATFYADGVSFDFDTTSTGWLTKSNVRGNSITKYNPLEITRRDTDSITSFGTNSVSLKLAYQDKIKVGEIEADRIVEQERQPDTEATNVRFLANNSDKEMQAFLLVQTGDLVHIKEDRSEIDSFYYIFGTSYVISQGGVIDFSYRIKRSRSLLSGGLTAIAVEFTGQGDGQAIRYPAVQKATGDLKTMMAHIHINAFQTDVSSTVLQVTDRSTDQRFFRLFFDEDNTKALYFTGWDYDTQAGWWKTADDILVAGNDYTVAVSYDVGLVTNDPIFYIDGIETPTFVDQANLGDRKDEVEEEFSFYIGGAPFTAAEPITNINGIVKNARYYDRILTPAEHLASVSEVITDGLIFQAPNVVTDRISDYINMPLAETDKLIDNIFGVVGTPLNTPSGRGF